MRALLIGVLVAGIVASPAVAAGQKLPVRQGRGAVVGYAEREAVRSDATYRVLWCHPRKLRTEVGCWVRWDNAPGLIAGATGSFKSAVRVRWDGHRLRVWEPIFDGPNG